MSVDALYGHDAFKLNRHFYLFKAFVKVNYGTSGYADVTLKGLTGNELFHKKINGKFWFDGADYYGPKWGLYRAKSDLFNDSDFMFFQNVQIWRN